MNCPALALHSTRSSFARVLTVPLIPAFGTNTQHFKFHTRLQRLNALDANAKVQNTYLDGLQSFWENQGQPLSRLPHLDRRPVNLFMLKKEVERRGGLNTVTERKMWADIGRSMGFSRETCTSLSHSLKSFYTKWVQPYDVYVATNKSAHSPGPKRATSPAAAAAPAKPASKGGRYGGGGAAKAAATSPALAPAPATTPAPSPALAAASPTLAPSVPVPATGEATEDAEAVAAAPEQVSLVARNPRTPEPRLTPC